MKPLEQIRDELAMKWLYSSDEKGHNTNKDKIDAFKAGFAEMEKRAEELVKALERIDKKQKWYKDQGHHCSSRQDLQSVADIARQALENWRKK